ncbi:MAG: TerC family protein [Gammaproteobacteria bacterium]|nr:TerC family protein [Gammaproteobacteria bacterium]
MLDLLANPEVWVAFLTLTLLEIVLGIDNIVFISILTGRLPEHQRARARLVGLSAAMFMRIALLLSLSWIMSLSEDLFEVFGHGISGRDIILVAGGAFLIAKATREMHNSLEYHAPESHVGEAVARLGAVLFQIAIIDMVFSLDSVITAVGLVDEVPVMIAAIVTAVLVMMVAAGPVSRFIEDHPTLKMLALSFLLIIGFALVAEGVGLHVPKGYIYVAMGFSLFVEVLNIGAKRNPVKLRKAQLGDLLRVPETGA